VVALMGATASEIFVTTILATLSSTIAAIAIVKFLEKRKRFAIVPDAEQKEQHNG
jgi:spore maturation protein SpmA